MGKLTDVWLTTVEMCRRTGVSQYFLSIWFRRSRTDSDYEYPKQLRARENVHYELVRRTNGRGRAKFIRWNPELVTSSLLRGIHEYHIRSWLEKVKTPMNLRSLEPIPEAPDIQIWCPWKERYLSQKQCLTCWCNKPDNERPDGYQWQEHCQRGIEKGDG